MADFLSVDMAHALRPDMLVRYGIQFVLLCLSGFFSGSETALFSLSHVDLRQLRRERHPQVQTLHALLDEPRKLIVSILCGNEIVNIAAIANMTGISPNPRHAAGNGSDDGNVLTVQDRPRPGLVRSD